MKKITLSQPLDMHLHLRDAEMLRLVTPLVAESFAGAVIMPNLVPPVDSLEKVLSYRERIMSTLSKEQVSSFKPLMTLFFRNCTESELASLQPHIFALKLYPAGATTNSDGGVRAIEQVEPTLKLMEEMGIPLLVHGESHGFVMDREHEFLPVYRTLAEKFPKLSITMEHITTADALTLLDEYENLRGTITLHHLLLTLDDVIGGMMNPYLFCKPIAKRPEDREALVQAVMSGHPRLMFGSDSAPHSRHKKESGSAAGGIFTTPFVLPYLAQLFDEHNALDKLQGFVSGNAQALYHMELPQKNVVLEKGIMTIPDSYEGFGENVIPMFPGKSLSWRFE